MKTITRIPGFQDRTHYEHSDLSPIRYARPHDIRSVGAGIGKGTDQKFLCVHVDPAQISGTDGVAISTPVANSAPDLTYEDTTILSWEDLVTSGSCAPTYKTNILNGYPALRFDGTDDYIWVPKDSYIGRIGDFIYGYETSRLPCFEMHMVYIPRGSRLGAMAGYLYSPATYYGIVGDANVSGMTLYVSQSVPAQGGATTPRISTGYTLTADSAYYFGYQQYLSNPNYSGGGTNSAQYVHQNNSPANTIINMNPWYDMTYADHFLMIGCNGHPNDPTNKLFGQFDLLELLIYYRNLDYDAFADSYGAPTWYRARGKWSNALRIREYLRLKYSLW